MLNFQLILENISCFGFPVSVLERFVVSQGISSWTKFRANITFITRVVYVLGFNVFIQNRVILGSIIAVGAFPSHYWIFYHFWPYLFGKLWKKKIMFEIKQIQNSIICSVFLVKISQIRYLKYFFMPVLQFRECGGGRAGKNETGILCYAENIENKKTLWKHFCVLCISFHIHYFQVFRGCCLDTWDRRAFRVGQNLPHTWQLYPTDKVCLDSTCSNKAPFCFVTYSHTWHLHRLPPPSVISFTIFDSMSPRWNK